ncbi:acyl-CoA dehydrogenase, partial [Candidatus Sumerlaeota bacterium]|nr:acyl-CoA dehydrogenase [Candidatus Sumerlaeota bacterium]
PEGPLSLLGGPVEEEALSSGKLSWRASRAPWGKVARHGVFSTPRDGKTCIGLVETGEAEIRPGENIAREPRDDLTFLAAPVILGEAAGLPGNATELYGAMIRSAQMAGALQALLDLSVRYAGERIQFGRPIAKFQIIQQELARLAGETAAAGIAAQAAFRAADRIDRDGWDPLFEIASAKVRVGEAAGIGPSIAHQVHGAIGFTYEHRLHFVTRRLWSWRAEYGAERYWAGILGRAAIGRGAEALWPFVTSR